MLTKIKNNINNINLLINILGFFALVMLVIFSPNNLVYDEGFHQFQVELLNEYGLSMRFLQGSDESAPGPTYAIIHYLFQSLTNLEAPQIRIINVVLLLVIILIIKNIASLLDYQNSWNLSFSIMSIPFIWPVSGMALTEIPAMFFACLGVYFLLLGMKNDTNKVAFSSVFLGGFLFSFAILGRQTFLLILFCLPFLIITFNQNFNINQLIKSINKKQILTILLFIIPSLILPIIQFIIWGGLVPSGQKAIGSGYSLIHFFLSLAYGGVGMFLLTPNWFNLKSKIYLQIVIITGGINLIFGWVEIIPFSSLAKKVLPNIFVIIYGRFTSSLLMSIGVIFIISTVVNIWKNRNNQTFSFFAFAILLSLFGFGKITHLFSSRYVTTIVPFMILASPIYYCNNFSKILLTITGNILGFFSLYSYFI
ncbi:hypothetical protein ACN4EE_11960 [Geminocystis sp. CENA526]|uniref:hypothetical protein n=1 Tax=Geminocystis sp. CENA526 TaxID=1355871 RepID=UPI003D6F62B3